MHACWVGCLAVGSTQIGSPALGCFLGLCFARYGSFDAGLVALPFIFTRPPPVRAYGYRRAGVLSAPSDL